MTTLATNLRRVTDVAVNKSGRILVADAGAGVVYALSPAGELTPLAGGGGQRVENGLPARSASLRTLIALAATPGEGVLAVHNETDGTPRAVFIGPGSDERLATDVRAATQRGGKQARQRSRDIRVNIHPLPGKSHLLIYCLGVGVQVLVLEGRGHLDLVPEFINIF